MKRKIGQIAWHLDVALEDLEIMLPPFEEQPPEHAAVLKSIVTGIVMSEQMLRKFAELTYGHCPKRLAVWNQ